MPAARSAPFPRLVGASPLLASLLACGAVPTAAAQGLRADAGVAFGVAGVAGSLDEQGETLTGVDDFAGGGVGPEVSGALWYDFASGASLGVQGFAGQAGLEVEVEGEEIDGERDAYGAMAMLAYRKVAGRHHPYGGLGLGYTWVEASYEQREDDLLELDLRGEYGSITGAVYGGYGYDLAENAYLGFRTQLRADEGEVEARDLALPGFVSGGSAEWAQLTMTLELRGGVKF